MTDTTPASPQKRISRWLVPAAVILVLGIILYNFFVGAQRRMVEKDEVANENGLQ